MSVARPKTSNGVPGPSPVSRPHTSPAPNKVHLDGLSPKSQYGGLHRRPTTSMGTSSHSKLSKLAPIDPTVGMDATLVDDDTLKTFPTWLLTRSDFTPFLKERLVDPHIIALQKTPRLRTEEEVQNITYWLKSCEVISPLTQEQIHGLCSLARRKVFKPSEIICQCAEEHEAFYLVLSGRVAVITPEVGKIGELKSTDSFGELPHMKVQHYNYGAIAKETTECIIINKKDAATLFADVGDSELNDTIQFLRGNALFFNWPRSHLIRLCSALKKETYPPNGFIIRQGDDSHNMYIIKKGRCVVRRDVVVTKTNRWPSGKDSWEVRQRNFVKTVTMSYLNTGDYFGENGVLTGKKRFASVVAESVVQILALNKKDFSLLAYGQTLDIFKETILGYKGLDQVKALVVKSESSGDGAKDIKATSSNMGGGKATKHIGAHASVDEIAKAKIMGTIKTIMDTVPQKQFSCHFDVEGAIMKKKKRTHSS